MKNTVADRARWRAYYQENREAKLRIERQRHRRRIKMIHELKSVPCADCGQTFDPVCMDFDHVRGRKLFNIGHNGCGHGIKEILAEIAKCIVVCANCHRLRTKRRRQHATHGSKSSR